MSAAVQKCQPSIELADWLLSEQARFASSICCNDPAVKMHIAWLKSGEQEVRSHASLKADNEQLRKALEETEADLQSIVDLRNPLPRAAVREAVAEQLVKIKVRRAALSPSTPEVTG